MCCLCTMIEVLWDREDGCSKAELAFTRGPCPGVLGVMLAELSPQWG